MSKSILFSFYIASLIARNHNSTNDHNNVVYAVQLKAKLDVVSKPTKEEILEELQSNTTPITTVVRFFDPEAFDEVAAIGTKLYEGYEEIYNSIREMNEDKNANKAEIRVAALEKLISMTMPHLMQYQALNVFAGQLAAAQPEQIPGLFNIAAAEFSEKGLNVGNKNPMPHYETTVENIRFHMKPFSQSKYFDQNGMTLLKGQDATPLAKVLAGKKDVREQYTALKHAFELDSGIGLAKRDKNTMQVFKFEKQSMDEETVMSPTFLGGAADAGSTENNTIIDGSSDNEHIRAYSESVAKSVKAAIPSAEYVFVMQQAVRSSLGDPATDTDSFSSPAPLIHSDYSTEKMLWLAKRIMGRVSGTIRGEVLFPDTSTVAEDQDDRRREISFANVWRNARETPVFQYHLGMCAKNSVRKDDVDTSRHPKDNGTMSFQLNPPVDGLSTMMFVPSKNTVGRTKVEERELNTYTNENHKWFYAPGMTSDEALVFLQGKAEIFQSDIHNPQHTGHFADHPENYVSFHSSVDDVGKNYVSFQESVDDRGFRVFSPVMHDDFQRVSIETRVMVVHYEGYNTNGCALKGDPASTVAGSSSASIPTSPARPVRRIFRHTNGTVIDTNADC